jgi:hypothetical protein
MIFASDPGRAVVAAIASLFIFGSLLLRQCQHRLLLSWLSLSQYKHFAILSTPKNFYLTMKVGRVKMFKISISRYSGWYQRAVFRMRKNHFLNPCRSVSGICFRGQTKHPVIEGSGLKIPRSIVASQVKSVPLSSGFPGNRAGSLIRRNPYVLVQCAGHIPALPTTKNTHKTCSLTGVDLVFISQSDDGSSKPEAS